jgi:SAM-dependent methyltransferase
VPQKDSWVKKSARVAAFEQRPTVLHVDGGREYIWGWLNANIAPGRHDIAFDAAQACAGPLPLDEDSVDGIHLGGVLENVRDAQPLFDELWRVAKPGARLFVRVPHGARGDALDGPAAQRAWYEGSFAHLASPTAASHGRGDWSLDTVGVIDDAQGAPREVVAALTAVKPARPRGQVHPAPVPPIHRLADGRVDPAFRRI